MIYIYTAQWHRKNMSFPDTISCVTHRHPILELLDWQRRNSDESPKLLWYHAIGEEQLGDIELQMSLDHLISSHDGELVGCTRADHD